MDLLELKMYRLYKERETNLIMFPQDIRTLGAFTHACGCGMCVCLCAFRRYSFIQTTALSQPVQTVIQLNPWQICYVSV